MNRPRRLLTVVLALAVAGATAGYVFGRQATAEDGSKTRTVRGVVGSETLRYLTSPDVARLFAGHGITLQLDARGSRDMAATDLSRYDFALPSGTAAAEDVTRRRPAAATPVSPFFSPLAIATFEPIVNLLAGEDLAHRAGPGHWVLDLRTFVAANGRNLRWDQVGDNAVYPHRRNVLVRTTRPGDSNSAAMFAVLLADVTGRDLNQVTKPFADQGALEATTEEPFEAYLRSGIDGGPLVLAYESQFVDRVLSGDGTVAGGRTLIYPSPTVENRHTVVPFTDAGRVVADLLKGDTGLLDLAGRHGFRTADPRHYRPAFDTVRPGGAPLPAGFDSVVEAPTAADLANLIAVIEERLT